MKKAISVFLVLVIGITILNSVSVNAYTTDVENFTINEINSGQISEYRGKNYYKLILNSKTTFKIDFDGVYDNNVWGTPYIKIIKNQYLDDYIIGKNVPIMFYVRAKHSVNESYFTNCWYDGTVTLNQGNYIIIIENEYDTSEMRLLNYTLLFKKTKNKLSQNIQIKTNVKTIKQKALKRKKRTVKLLTIKDPKGKITVTKLKNGTTSSLYKKISVNKSTGKITLKKGKYAKKTYNIKLKVKVSGNSNYKAASKKVTVKLRIK